MACRGGQYTRVYISVVWRNPAFILTRDPIPAYVEIRRDTHTHTHTYRCVPCAQAYEGVHGVETWCTTVARNSLVQAWVETFQPGG